MKVCKFEKMKEEDEIRQVINYILKEHPYVVVVPTLTQLQEWLQDISISWFHEEDSASHATINNIEEYCRTLADHLITDLPLNTDIKKYIRECIEKMHKLVEDKADLLIDKIIKAEIYRLSGELFAWLPASVWTECPHIGYRYFYANESGKETGYPLHSGIYQAVYQ